jgi:hypothetical protein
MMPMLTLLKRRKEMGRLRKLSLKQLMGLGSNLKQELTRAINVELSRIDLSMLFVMELGRVALTLQVTFIASMVITLSSILTTSNLKLLSPILKERLLEELEPTRKLKPRNK